MTDNRLLEKDYIIKILTGSSSDKTAVVESLCTVGELLYTTDNKILYVHNGTSFIPVPNYIFYESINTDTTLNETHGFVDVDASSAETSITLPASSGLKGRSYTIRKSDTSTNKVVIDPNASETINGASTLDIIFQYDSVTLRSDNTNWVIE